MFFENAYLKKKKIHPASLEGEQLQKERSSVQKLGAWVLSSLPVEHVL